MLKARLHHRAAGTVANAAAVGTKTTGWLVPERHPVLKEKVDPAQGLPDLGWATKLPTLSMSERPVQGMTLTEERAITPLIARSEFQRSGSVDLLLSTNGSLPFVDSVSLR